LNPGGVENRGHGKPPGELRRVVGN
jgi:hypothetical protein